jgi:hypothetical protein
MGHVGLVLGLEMSRLARAGQDWHQLIELCSLAGALLADADGVYDPNWYNDRLLLGLSAPRLGPVFNVAERVGAPPAGLVDDTLSSRH